MEQQLTNEEIARVFAMYYGIDCNFSHTGKVNSGTIHDALVAINKKQLTLTTLSKIRDEDAIEVAKILNYRYGKLMSFKTALLCDLSEKSNMLNILFGQSAEIFQYLISKG